MYICELLPLKTTKKISSLTYFTSLDVSVGDLVSINMNGQMLQAIAITCSDIRNSKSEIKAQDFKIKKILKIIKKGYVSGELLSEIYNIASLLGVTTSNMFNTLCPINILPEINFEKRQDRTLLRQGFAGQAKKEHIHIICPTNLEVRKIKKAIKGENNIIYTVSTPNLEFLKMRDGGEVVNRIIINNESSRYYYSIFKNIDVKKAIIHICKVLNIQISYDDTLPSLERYVAEEFEEKRNREDKERSKETETELEHFSKKTEDKEKKEIEIIKMTDNIYLCDRLEKNILKILNSPKTENKKILLFAMRRGAHTQSVCRDCSTVVRCKKCDKPYTLHIEKDSSSDQQEARYHVCHSCHDKIRLESLLRCENCNSWRIDTLGIGTQGVERYLRELLDKNKKESYNIHRIDSDNTNSVSKVEKEYARFLASANKL